MAVIAIIDYGMGNLRSVQKAFEAVGAEALLTHERADILKADKIVLPGVGAMGPAMRKLEEMAFIEPIKQGVKEGKPFFGICLGMQLLFEESAEGGVVRGLNILEGRVEKFADLKVPHMGWNQITKTISGQGLLQGLSDGDNVYFCHSYFVKPKNQVIAAAITNYGVDFVSAVVKDNVWGVQFHPEKSQTVGLQILRNFVAL